MVAVDAEGDSREDGQCKDMGADEYAPHLYHLDGVPGGADLELRLAGHAPGDTATIWLDLGLRPFAAQTPFGSFWLESRRYPVAWSQSVPASGTLRVPVDLPTAIAPGTPLYTQAFCAGTLTNFDTAVAP